MINNVKEITKWFISNDQSTFSVIKTEGKDAAIDNVHLYLFTVYCYDTYLEPIVTFLKYEDGSYVYGFIKVEKEIYETSKFDALAMNGLISFFEDYFRIELSEFYLNN